MLALVLTLALSAQTSPGDPPAAPAASSTAAPAGKAQVARSDSASDPDKVICKSVVTTGTRFATKDCRTKGEWDAIAAESRSVTSSAQAGFVPPR